MVSFINAYLEPQGLWIPKSESAPIEFGVNLYLPLSLRTKNPLIFRTLWAQYGSPTVAGAPHLDIGIVGYDESFSRVVPLGITYAEPFFTGGVAGYEDVYTDINLAPYINGNLTLNSIGFIWSRDGTAETDLLDATVIFRNARTLL